MEMAQFVNRTLVFVYGTLKKGERAEDTLRASDFLGAAETAPLFRMYTGPSFPMLMRKPDNGFSVYGELYKVNDSVFARLDQYEGYPSFYTRSQEPVRLISTGEQFDAWVYHGANHPLHMTQILPNDDDKLIWSSAFNDKIPF